MSPPRGDCRADAAEDRDQLGRGHEQYAEELAYAGIRETPVMTGVIAKEPADEETGPWDKDHNHQDWAGSALDAIHRGANSRPDLGLAQSRAYGDPYGPPRSPRGAMRGARNVTSAAARSGSLRSLELMARGAGIPAAIGIPSISDDAGGGTRTPDTRIMIPLL